MYRVHKEQILNYSAEQLFNLVNDINLYSEFLPCCYKSVIEDQSINENEPDIVIATASIYLKLGFISQKFTTINVAKPHYNISISLKNGPFKYLNGIWNFKKINSKKTLIQLQLEFEFSNQLIDKTFGRVFTPIANSLLASFVSRAKQVYEPR